MQTFPRLLRLLSAEQFQCVWKAGKRLSVQTIAISYRHNDLGYPRLGVIVSKRNVRLAVDRNRLKRLARETFRRRQAKLGGQDIVITLYKGADSISPSEQYQRFNALWDRFTAQFKKI